MKIIAGALLASGVAAWQGGVHVHTGFNCTVPGGHYVIPTDATDVWLKIKYTATTAGTSDETLKVADSGVTAADLGTAVAGTNRVYVVHEEGGDKVSCTVPSELDGKIATMGVYPGYNGTTLVTGTVQVTASTGTSGDLNVFLNLEGLEPSTIGGVHVHAGISCDTADAVKGHYWTPASIADPWIPSKWNSTAGGASLSSITVSNIGYTPAEIDGRAIVVHNAAGDKVACGLLAAANGKVHGGIVSVIPGYTGDKVVTGSIYVTGGATDADPLYVRTKLANLNAPAATTPTVTTMATTPTVTTTTSASTATFGVASLLAGLFARLF